MLIYDIPGRGIIEVENLVLDYNGTIAVDGKLLAGVRELLTSLEGHVAIYVLTADTYGTAKEECKFLEAEVISFPKENAGEHKRLIVKNLEGSKTICMGNGFNDIPMFKEAAISVAIIQGEGASGELLRHADIVARSIGEALGIILNENMVKATLRN